MTSKSRTIALFEAFAGIGSQFQALKNIADEKGWNIKLVGMIEWFIPAIIGHYSLHFGSPNNNIDVNTDIYRLTSNDSKTPINEKYLKKIINSKIAKYLIASHQECNNSFDINKTTYKNVPKNIDIFTYSFPCQDLSIQGKQRGMARDAKTRSSLLWQVERLFYELKQNYLPSEMPKYLLMENVSQISNSKNINELKQWEKSLAELGYKSKLYMLNAKDFGLPQNRLRAFLLSVHQDHLKQVDFMFPDKISSDDNQIQSTINSILKPSSVIPSDLLVNLQHYELSNLVVTKSNIKRRNLIGYTKFNSESYVYDQSGIGPTLTATGANSRIKILQKNGLIRKLSNLENFLYMGFDQEAYQAIKNTNLIPDNKLTFLCGNAIAVPVLEAIFRKLIF